MVPVNFCSSKLIFQVGVGRLFGIFSLKFRLLKFTSVFFKIDHEQSNAKAFLYFTKPWTLPCVPDIYDRLTVNQDQVWRSAIDGNQVDGAAPGKICEDEIALTDQPR